MQTDTDKQYDADEDPDSDPARTPTDVEAKIERDQAEGDAPSAPADRDAN